MKIIRSRPLKDGKIRLTVDLSPNEELKVIKPDGFYQMGYPNEEILQGRIIEDAK